MNRRSFLKPLPLFAFYPVLKAATWTQWRGPGRDGQATDTGLLKEWPADGPPVAWTGDGLGAGYSSLAMDDGKLFTQGQRGGRQYLIALSSEDAAKLWETENGGSYTNGTGDGPRGTPTIDGDRVYAISGRGNLICAETSTGKPVWQIDLLARFGARNISWGISESPLVDGDRVIVSPGGRNAGIVALNKMDGNVIWQSQSDTASYSSAVSAQIAGIHQYILLTGSAAVGLRASDGKLLWRYEKVANGTANAATPIVNGNAVFLSSDYGTGCALLEISPNGSGGAQAEEVYFNREMRNHYSSSVLIDGKLYGYSSRILTCMDFDTGIVEWRDRSVGKGQVITAEGLLYVQGEDGDAALVEASPDSYREISRFHFGKHDYQTWALPVISAGHLLLRDQDRVTCYDIRAQRR